MPDCRSSKTNLCDRPKCVFDSNFPLFLCWFRLVIGNEAEESKRVKVFNLDSDTKLKKNEKIAINQTTDDESVMNCSDLKNLTETSMRGLINNPCADFLRKYLQFQLKISAVYTRKNYASPTCS